MRRSFAVWTAALAILSSGVLMPAATAATAPPDQQSDPQSVVVRVPGPTGTATSPGQVCPDLGRADFTYTFTTVSRSTVLDDWRSPTRITSDEPPSQVTIALADDVEIPEGRNCRYAFSLASYSATASSDGTQSGLVLSDVATGVIDAERTTLTLVVALSGCFTAIELYTGEARHASPSAVPGGESVAGWDGDRDCVGPGVVADLVVVAVPPCPAATSLSWLVINPNGRAVEVALATEGGSSPWSAGVLALPGSTPVIVGQRPAPDAVLVASWVDSAGATRSARSTPVAPLAPGTPEYDVRCLGASDPAVTLIKTAVPPPGEAVAPGRSMTWTVTVINQSAVALSQVAVLDVIPAYASVSDAGGAVAGAGTLSWAVDLPAGGRVALHYSGVVVAAAPDGVDLVNTAVVPLTGQADTTVHPIRLQPVASASPTPPPQAAGAVPRGPLSFTGADVTTALLVAAFGIVLGVAFVLVTRRGRRDRTVDPQAA